MRSKKKKNQDLAGKCFRENYKEMSCVYVSFSVLYITGSKPGFLWFYTNNFFDITFCLLWVRYMLSKLCSPRIKIEVRIENRKIKVENKKRSESYDNIITVGWPSN